MIGGKKVKKKYSEPEFELLKVLLSADVLSVSTGEDNVDDVGGTLPDGGDDWFDDSLIETTPGGEGNVPGADDEWW